MSVSMSMSMSVPIYLNMGTGRGMSTEMYADMETDISERKTFILDIGLFDIGFVRYRNRLKYRYRDWSEIGSRDLKSPTKFSPISDINAQ